MIRHATRPWFTVGDQGYTGADVLLAARWWGEWDRFQAQVRMALAPGQEIEDEPLEAAAGAFRAARELLAAQDMQRWLDDWDFTVQGWYASLARALALAQLSEAAPQNPGDADANDTEFDECLRYDGVCHGTFRRWAERLAALAAVHARVLEHLAMAHAPDAEPRRKHEFAAGLTAAERSAFERLLRLERDAAACRDALLTDAALAREISAHALRWITLDCATACFPELEMAREARLSVTTDGMSLEEAAALARQPARRRQLLLEDAPAEHQATLLSAQAGTLVGPLADGMGFVLYFVHEKQLPELQVAAVRERAAQALWTAAVERECAQRVRWLVRW